MKRKLRNLIGLAALVLAGVTVTGCQSVRDAVPATEIHGYIGNQPFSFIGPKDLTLGSLTVSAQTNGTVSLVISNLTAKTSPDVITTTGDAQAKLIQATASAVQGIMTSGGQAAGQAAGAAIK